MQLKLNAKHQISNTFLPYQKKRKNNVPETATYGQWRDSEALTLTTELSGKGGRIQEAFTASKCVSTATTGSHRVSIVQHTMALIK